MGLDEADGAVGPEDPEVDVKVPHLSREELLAMGEDPVAVLGVDESDPVGQRRSEVPGVDAVDLSHPLVPFDPVAADLGLPDAVP